MVRKGILRSDVERSVRCHFQLVRTKRVTEFLLMDPFSGQKGFIYRVGFSCNPFYLYSESAAQECCLSLVVLTAVEGIASLWTH